MVYIPRRYIFVILAHFGFFCVYALRVNLSVVIVSMVNQTFAGVGSTKSGECGTGADTNTTRNNKDGEFKWNQNQQGLLLSSFFYGYLLTQVWGGWVANKYGGKWIFALGMLSTIILTALTPMAAHVNFYFLLAIRVLEGVGEGVTFPAAHAMIGLWSPAGERSRMTTSVYAGVFTGTVVTLPLAAILADSTFLKGWPSAFYVFAVISFIWLLLWIFFVYDSPDQHPSISGEEKKLIMSSLKDTANVSKDIRVPWCDIMTSVPFSAICVAHVCKNWVWYMILTGLPSYFKAVLNFNLKANGGLSALPFVAGFVFQFAAGWLTDWLQNNKMSKKRTKRLITILGFYPTSIMLILVSYVHCDQVYLSVFLMVLATGLLSFNNSAYNINDLDLSPRYAGTLMGIKNFLGTIPGCIAPSITGLLTNDDPSRENYRKVFIIAAVLSAFGGTFYLLFLSGSVQPWNDINYRRPVTANDDVLKKDVEAEKMAGQTNPAFETDASTRM